VKIRHFYHLYLDGDASWLDIAVEYADAIRAAAFPVAPAVGIVGADRIPAKLWLAGQPHWTVTAEAEEGYEQVTLTALQDQLPSMADDDSVLYTHAKGVWRNMPLEDQWRRSMLWHLVFGWQNCVRLLRTHQTVGCHWRNGSHYAGNFWWATAGYLKTLPPIAPAVTENQRHHAELWLGLGEPLAANLVEGFPPAGTEEGARLASGKLPVRWVKHRTIST